MKERLKRFFHDRILWMFLTNHCPYCGKIIEKDKTLCDNCSEKLPVIKGEKCKYCGAEKLRCNCKKQKLCFDGITAPFHYEDGIKQAIYRLKLDKKLFLAKRLAKDMSKVVKEDFGDKKFDFICYVPFSKIQKIKRDYNQSELLAENLAKELNIPLNDVMVKLFETKAQHTMSMQKRTGNVFGVFDIKKRADVKGKTILLVDDVKTSGSTLDACSAILKIRGASEVYCVTVAIAGIKGKEEKTESE